MIDMFAIHGCDKKDSWMTTANHKPDNDEERPQTDLDDDGRARRRRYT